VSKSSSAVVADIVLMELQLLQTCIDAKCARQSDCAFSCDAVAAQIDPLEASVLW
jgi:hypothetical protein